MENFQEKLDSFVVSCQNMIDTYMANHFPRLPRKVLSTTKGKRYIKVIKEGSGVFCFVDTTTGDVLKAASWSIPAKGSRGNIFDAHNGLARMSAYGPAYNK